jgi:hypothetical protein
MQDAAMHVAQRDAAAAPSTNTRPTRLTIDFTTGPSGGKYSPRNVGVAWVADAQKKWVHTFELWSGAANFGVFTTYTMAGGPDYLAVPPSTVPQMPPPADVITSATFVMHRAHAGETWDLKDASGNEVSDGSYTLVIEVAEDSMGHVFAIPFRKAGESAVYQGVDSPGLRDVTLRLE